MFYLLLAIICSTCLLLIFKFIQRYQTDTLPVIVVNYFVCGIIGAFTSPERISVSHLAEKEWLLPTIGLGVLFICVFNMVAASTQLNGIAITAVAFKLSVVIPVVVAFYLYHDRFTFLKVTGILLAVVAIFLTSKDDSNKNPTAKGFASLLPALVFLGSGISDAVFNYIQATFLSENDHHFFLVVLFVTAGAGGLVAFVVLWLKNRSALQPKTLLAGIVLGIPNYGSAYFMILALERSGVESSALWPLNNIGIILLSTVTAALFFKERINRYGIAGIAIAILSILMIGIASCY